MRKKIKEGALSTNLNLISPSDTSAFKFEPRFYKPTGTTTHRSMNLTMKKKLSLSREEESATTMQSVKATKVPNQNE